MRVVPSERAAMSDLFDELGPDAPTVLPGWTAKELLAHLLVRERQPLAAPGILVPALARFADSAMRSYDNTPWAEQVELLRSGAPAWSPFWLSAVDERANLTEFVVHYADLSRAQPKWTAPPTTPERDEKLWSWLRMSARIFYKKSPVGVVLRHPTRERGADIRAKAGAPAVTVTGPPAELVLHAFGRDVAAVELQGAPADVAALTSTPRGI